MSPFLGAVFTSHQAEDISKATYRIWVKSWVMFALFATV